MIFKLNLKQKIIIAVIFFIIIVVIAIFFTSQNDENIIEIGQMIEVIDNTIEANSQLSEEKIEEKQKIVVHITGEVKKVGIVTLEEGARISDAIKAAGGETKEADLNEINLAYVLEDGQKIYIPNKKDKNQNKEIVYITNESGNNVSEKENAENKEVNKKVNINKANQNELENLPGIGPSIANRIIEYREINGEFQKIEDLQNVKGIGDSKYANIKDYVCLN